MGLPNDRGAPKEMCAPRGVPSSPKDALERVKNRLRKAPPATILHERGGGGLSDDDDVDMSNGHGSNGHTNGHGIVEHAARAARRMSVGELRETLGRENLDKTALVELYARTRHSAVPEAAPVASTVSKAARDVRCELAYLGEDVSDDDMTLQRRRALLKEAYEEEEEEEESDDESEPEVADEPNRLPKRFGGRPKFPSRRARDWALDDMDGAHDQDITSLGAAMASAVDRWASRSEEDDWAYHIKCVEECVELGARFDEPLTDRDLRDRADRRVDWRCDNEYSYRGKRDEIVDELAWRGVWCPRKATEEKAKRRLRYDDNGGPSAPEEEEEDEEDYSESEEEGELIGDPVEDAVAAAVAADAWHYLEMLRIENDEELKALREEERQAELEDLRNIPRLTSSHLSHFFGDPRYGLRCRLVALGHDNRVRVCGPDFQTSFVGAAFPLGYELFDKNYAFMEPENCEDLKRGFRDREVHEDDIATCYGFARVRYDDREQRYTYIGEAWSWMWPYSSPITMHGRRFTEARRADRELLGKKAAVGAMFGWRDYL